ncbi:ankyrin repeat-containing domain protein [Lentinula raphanica]|nr:ankyrin repeat-containing domain protein [Lentinula raphanica]
MISYNLRSFGILNNAQNVTVSGGEFNVAGKDVNVNYYLSSDEEKKLQDWLAAPDSSSNYSTALNKRVAGTCQWIFQDPVYLKWKEEGSILWIQGQAGSGKTFLITSIIKNHKEANLPSLTIYHYFDTRDNSGKKASFQGLLLSFISQLGAQDRKMHPALKRLHESSRNGLSHFKPTNEELVNTLTKITKDLVQREVQVHIIIDALDECKEPEEVWKFCVHMGSLHSQIGIIISSRNFQPSSSKYSTISLRNNAMVDQDIATFLDKQLSFKSTTLNTEVKDKLMQKANGGFRYIDCQVQILKESANARRVHEAMTKLPSSLKETYIEAIKKCEDSSYSEEAHYLLLWLLYSFKPLYMSQVAIILSIDLKSREVDSDAEMLIGLEKIIDTTLVTVDDEDIVQLAHASVKDFLLESNSNIHTSKLLNLNAQLGHNIIAQMCLLYLLQQNEAKNIWADSLYTWKIDINTFEQYACVYWGEHTRSTERTDIACKETTELTDEFLENSSKAFMEWKKHFHSWELPEFPIHRIFADCNSLHVIACFGLHKSAQKLLNKTDAQNTYIDSPSEYIGTPLQTAAARGCNDIVELLLQYGAKVNVQSGYYDTAIQAAAFWGHADTIEILLQHGVDINIQGGHYGTAIQAAAVGGHTETVRLLFQNGADINAQGGNYNTAIQAAAANGYKDTVEFLLQHDADVNAQGGMYGTAIQAAAIMGHKEIVELLAQHGTDINAQDGHFGTAIVAAAVMGHKDIIECLIHHGIDVNTQGESYGTAIQAAAVMNHKDTVEFLLQHNADVNTQGGNFHTAIQAAATEGHKETVEILLNYGADVNIQGGYYNTALQVAALKGYKKIVELLLQYGADVNTQGGHYGTAIQAAAAGGHKDTVEILLEHGADVHVQSGYYDTAFQAAATRDHKDIIELIQDGTNIDI